MKKYLNYYESHWLYSNCQKLLLKMKITIFLFFIGLVNLIAGPGYSQNTKISLNMKDAPIESVLNEIEEVSEFYFLFNHKLIDVDRRVDVDAKNEPIKDILSEIFSKDIRFIVSDRQIVLIPEEESSGLVELLQPQSVNGKVTDAATGEAMAGVNIIIKGTNIGAITDITGNYSLTVTNREATLIFSFVGYIDQEVPLNGRTTLDISLIGETKGLDEVIVIGYGTQKKSDLTGSIQQVSTEKFQTQSTTNMVEMLTGTVAGFSSNQGTTASGGGSMEIRGITSLKANNNPLIVVDGVIYNGSIGDINPSDIKSIEVLKDASSSAIFGARAASGILIVTTKRGLTGSPSINFSAKMGIVGLTKIMRPLNPEEYIQNRIDYLEQNYTDKQAYYFRNPNYLPPEISLEQWKNYDVTPSNDPVDMWLNRINFNNTEKANYLAGKTVDWYDLVLQNGLRQDYDVSLSGGITNLKYYWSIGYTGNKGYILGDEFRSVRSRVNVDADIKDFLTVRLNLQYADRNQGFQKASLSESGSPYGQVYEEDGTMTWYTHEESVSGNPIIYYTYRDLFNKTQTMFGTISAEIKLPLGISYTTLFTPRYSWSRNYYFDPLETPNGGTNNGYGRRNNNSVFEWQVDNLLKWNKTIANIHSFDITFLFNVEKYQSWNEAMTNTQFAPSDALSYHAMAAGITPSISSNDEYSTGNALMGRINYTLLSKYLLTMTLRRDGYSAFGQANPYAFFPSFALGWKISEEDFFKIRWIDNTKVRFSWGVNGNRDIGRYDALAKLSTLKYLYGNTLAVGVYTSTMANSGLKWERTEAYNLGFDVGILNNRISTTIDLYNMTTYDLLLDRSLPSIIGYKSVASNLGELNNKGFEITLNANDIIKSSKIQWNSSLVFSFNRNKIIHLYGEMIDVTDKDGNVIGKREADDWTNNWFIGHSINQIWDFEVLGVWQLEEAEEAAIYGRNPGEMKLRDTNKDGKLIPADDKIFQGYKKPQFLLGLGNDVTFLRNFQLSTFIRGDLGFYTENNIDEGTSWIDRRNILYAPYWTTSNPNNEYGRVCKEKDAPYNVYKNSSFIRLQDVSLSYNVPKPTISKLKINSLKLFISLRNYLTITKWDHWDPESGMSPMPKYFTFGIDTNF